MCPCNVSKLESLCDAGEGCAGFNTHGWLQAHIDPASLENTTACDFYIRDAGPALVLPSAPPGSLRLVREDYHYPGEEAVEAAEYSAPNTLAINDAVVIRPCTVPFDGSKLAQTVDVPGSFDSWETLACVRDTAGTL